MVAVGTRIFVVTVKHWYNEVIWVWIDSQG